MEELKQTQDMDEIMESQPWDPIESKLVGYSIILGIIALVVLGFIINVTILK